LENIMIDLDEMLDAAGSRAAGATHGLALPGVPRPTRPVGMYAGVGAVATLSVVAGAVGMSRGSNRTSAGKVPQSFLDGAHGKEVVIKQIDDGDNDPTTVLLDAGPAGTVKLYPATSQAVATTVAVAATTAVGQRPEPTAVLSGTCLDSNGGGICPMDSTTLGTVFGARSASGSFVVYSLPSSVVAVDFTSGLEHYWARPVHGIVAFPFTEAASPRVETKAYAADETVFASIGGFNDMITSAEIASRAVTTQTNDTLAVGWFVDQYSAVAPTSMGEITRYRGRTSSTGFTGPFTAQGSAFCGENCTPQERGSWIITVLSSQADEVRKRLAPLNGVLRSSEPSPGVTVLVWSEPSAESAKIDALVAASKPRAATPGDSISLDAPRAWKSEQQPFNGSAVPNALLSETIGTLEGKPVVAQADDLGTVQFRVHVGGTVYEAVQVDPSSAGLPAVPVEGSAWQPGPIAVPHDVTALTITLSDGRVIRPNLLDASAVFPARLFFTPGDRTAVPPPTITKVEVTRA
jgi:hypothetical protein